MSKQLVYVSHTLTLEAGFFTDGYMAFSFGYNNKYDIAYKKFLAGDIEPLKRIAEHLGFEFIIK